MKDMSQNNTKSPNSGNHGNGKTTNPQACKPGGKK